MQPCGAHARTTGNPCRGRNDAASTAVSPPGPELRKAARESLPPITNTASEDGACWPNRNGATKRRKRFSGKSNKSNNTRSRKAGCRRTGKRDSRNLKHKCNKRRCHWTFHTKPSSSSLRRRSGVRAFDCTPLVLE